MPFRPRGVQYWFDGYAYRISEKYHRLVPRRGLSVPMMTSWEGLCTVPFNGYLAYVRVWEHPEYGIDYEERPLQFNLG